MNPLLFIWIPKTAGTSTYTAIKEKHGMDLRIERHTIYSFNNKGNVTFGHLDPHLLLSVQLVNKDYWQSAYKFAVVRNPYERFVSLYFDFLRSKRLASDTSMIQFAQALLNMPRKPGLYNTFGFSQCASQVSWLLPGVTIFFYEDLGSLEKELDIKLPRLNQRTDASEHLSIELKKMIADLYYEDFCVFNYKI